MPERKAKAVKTLSVINLILFLNVILLLITAVGTDSPLVPRLTMVNGIVGFSVLI